LISHQEKDGYLFSPTSTSVPPACLLRSGCAADAQRMRSGCAADAQRMRSGFAVQRMNSGCGG
jgi:hypothetical protein